ncbi:ComF family protein [Priestia koreensis]|uniref:ComF family protein n=1 Tax=Priestia koreensis TaxID=284581 RepID=UPI0034592C21
MTSCLVCHGVMRNVPTWRFLIQRAENEQICADCAEKFELISGDTCRCGRSLLLLEAAYQENGQCLDCKRWEEGGDALTKNVSLYTYNEWMKDVMATFKFRGDYELREAFRVKWMNVYQQSFLPSHLVVPIPLSAKRLYERGFNQAEALGELLGIKTQNALTRLHSEKQSKRSRNQRLQSEQIFSVLTPGAVQGMSIVLIDDIYTTGTTVRLAARSLLEAGATEVASYTLARG